MIGVLLAVALQQATLEVRPASTEAVNAEELDSGPETTQTPLPDGIRLQIGSPVHLRLIEELSSKVTRKGDTFALEVTKDVSAEGFVVIPAGTQAVGEVTRAETKGAFGKSGKLEARILYLKLDGRTVRLTGALGVAGEGGTTETVLTAIAIGALAFVVTGKSAVLPAGTELVAITDRSVELPPAGQAQ